MFESRETGDWDIFLGPPERARAETGGADQWVLKRRELSGFARVTTVTSASLGYPLSVFNKNSTLKAKKDTQFGLPVPHAHTKELQMCTSECRTYNTRGCKCALKSVLHV